MLEYIWDGSQYHPIVNRREAHYNIIDCIKQIQAKWKGWLLSMQNMVKGLHQVFKAVVNEILQVLPIWGKYESEVSYFIPEPRKCLKWPKLSEDIKELG